jgi:branched-chain amino acid transport system ATP-binding protein
MSGQLTVTDVRHSFRGLHVLRGVSFDVAKGTLTGLIGPNGAGKSTLFNIVSGFLRPDAGTVALDGVDVSRQSVQQRARGGLMRTFQTPQVFPHLSVHENLMMGSFRLTRDGVLSGLLTLPGARAATKRMREAADAACDRFQLGAVRNRLAGTLPGGQQRLVELARAVAAKPRLLCLDEPSSGLNAAEVEQLMAMLLALNREGLTILLVSHDMDLVAIASTIHVLCFGEIIAAGPLDRVREDPRVREAYLGV